MARTKADCEDSACDGECSHPDKTCQQFGSATGVHGCGCDKTENYTSSGPWCTFCK